jgi:curli biogenesis system outer membrane secretion channel CsgG
MELALKNLGVLVLLLLTLCVVPRVQSQVKKRTAILRAGSPFPQPEQNIADQLITLLVESGKVEVIDRAQMAQIFNEQNMGNNLYYNPQQPRFSTESAVYLGKLLGVPALVFIRVDAYYGGQRPPVNNGKKHTISGNVVLKTTAQIVNVETGSIFAAPTASFDQERVLSESTDGRPPGVIGPFRIPQGKGTQGPDPNVAMRKLTEEAFDSVEHELASKIANALVSAPNLSARAQKIPKVAGVQNGMTFVNEGSNDGLKAGDTFQIVRMVDSGMQDPDTHKPISRKKQVCLLTISDVEDSLASGKCVGDLAQPGDQALAQGH